MNTPSRRMRLIESQGYFLLFGVLFTLAWYAIGYIYKPPALPPNSSITDFLSKYGVYIPLLLGTLSILKSYILKFIFWVLHLRNWFLTVCIYLLIYGFWLGVWIQLRYFEPRYTEIAIAIIDQYALPLICASSTVIIGVILLSFFKKK